MLIGSRLLGILYTVVCSVFNIYEGKKIDAECGKRGVDEDWYWTF